MKPTQHLSDQVNSIHPNSKVRYANTRFLQLAAALFLILTLIAIWLVRDQMVLLADLHKLQTETLSHTITHQKMARNLDELRRQGERVLFSTKPEERNQALLIVQLVVSNPAFANEVQVSALARDTERFLRASEAGSRFGEGARADWFKLTQRLSLLAGDISFAGLNLGVSDLKAMEATVVQTQKKLLAALVMVILFVLATLLLIQRTFIGPLGRVRQTIDHIDESTEQESTTHSSIREIQVIENSIDGLRMAQASMRESEARFRTVFEMSLDAIVLHRNGTPLFVNPAAVQMFGAKNVQELLDKTILELLHPDFHEHVLEQIKTGTEQGITVPRFEKKCIKFDGTVFDVEAHGQSIVLTGEAAVLTTLRDITDRKQSEAKLKIAASVFSNVREGITITDTNGTIIDINDSFTRITGYARAEALGQNSRFLKSDLQHANFHEVMWSDLATKGFWSGEIWNRRKDGETYPAQLTVQSVLDAQGKNQGYIALFTDITERKSLEEKMQKMAFFDALTGLPNRHMLNERLSQIMAASKRSGLYSALMFLDLDNFKPLNDTHGHDVGDVLLIEVARRLTTCLREVDTVARFGGDEFVVILSELDADKTRATELAAGVAEKIRASVAAPYLLTVAQPGEQGTTVEHYCSASIGVVIFINHEVSQPDIMKSADAAMYLAKEAGRNAFCFTT